MGKKIVVEDICKAAALIAAGNKPVGLVGGTVEFNDSPGLRHDLKNWLELVVVGRKYQNIRRRLREFQLGERQPDLAVVLRCLKD